MGFKMKLPRIPEIILGRLTNGWIVKIIYSGESALKEPFEHGVHVFETYTRASNFINKWADAIELAKDPRE